MTLLYFYICCSFSGQVMWFVCVVIPVLSLSLVGSPTDSQVMQRPTSNKQGAVISSRRVIFSSTAPIRD